MIGLTAVGQALDFGELMREHRAMVFSVAWHFLHDRDLAEETAQDVFLSLHKNLAGIETPAHACFWLRKVAVQRSIDAARKRQRRPQVALADVAEPSVRPAPGDPMLGGMLRRLIASLPETPRMAMILRYQEDLDPAEIAQTMGIPLGTVKSHIQRSLALLREKLERPRRGRTLMDWLEQELAQALARKEPADGFDGRVSARLHRPPRWMAIAATVLVMMGAGEAWRQHEGQLAKEQVMTAMRIAGSKLNRVQMHLKGTEQ